MIDESGSVALPTAQDTLEFGKRIGQGLAAGDVVVLSGPLGAGKTALT
ncbi:tRNA (adenosine(37)-N6)-threonylcarbamoyltransferase complex ATPase subunit type 1 TsaE, partial [Mycobacteroides abscessus]|nr:tRNA (adenosine(37)-N6)-threonylcarbamoyltransferase complex ATPase subunit type 1 TsaE [Mycobacteroides abscessus]